MNVLWYQKQTKLDGEGGPSAPRTVHSCPFRDVLSNVLTHTRTLTHNHGRGPAECRQQLEFGGLGSNSEPRQAQEGRGFRGNFPPKGDFPPHPPGLRFVCVLALCRLGSNQTRGTGGILTALENCALRGSNCRLPHSTQQERATPKKSEGGGSPPQENRPCF